MSKQVCFVSGMCQPATATAVHSSICMYPKQDRHGSNLTLSYKCVVYMMRLWEKWSGTALGAKSIFMSSKAESCHLYATPSTP